MTDETRIETPFGFIQIIDPAKLQGIKETITTQSCSNNIWTDHCTCEDTCPKCGKKKRQGYYPWFGNPAGPYGGYTTNLRFI